MIIAWTKPEKEGGKPDVHIHTTHKLSAAQMLSNTIEVAAISIDKYGRSPRNVGFSSGEDDNVHGTD